MIRWAEDRPDESLLPEKNPVEVFSLFTKFRRNPFRTFSSIFQQHLFNKDGS